MNLEDRIESFYQTRSNQIRRKPFLKVDNSGSYTYLIAPTSGGIASFTNRIRKPDLKRRILVKALQAMRTAPEALKYVPGVKLVNIGVAADEPFEFGIASSRLLTILAPEAGWVSKLGWESDERIRRELNIRQRLPDSLNTPDLIDTNEEFPYFVTQYIEGDSVVNPIENWGYILNALNQLKSWYEMDEIAWIQTRSAIDELETELGELRSDEVIKSALQQLKASVLPEQLAYGTVHGDLHGQNLLVADETVYILDWESTKQEYLLYDFIYPFLRYYKKIMEAIYSSN